MNTFWQDLRYGARVLLKSPGFTVVAIATLALGIGANAAIFSVVNAVLLRPLPFPQSNQLVRVWTQKAPTSVSKAELVELQSQNRSFENLAGYSGWSFTLTGHGEPAKLEGARTTAGFFSLLQIQAALGRTFLPDEDRPGKSNVALLSYASWQARFGSDPHVIGQSLTVDGADRSIVGVLPQSFKFPDSGLAQRKIELVLPATLDPSDGNDFTAGYLKLIGRLNPGVSPEQAEAEVIGIARNARTKLTRKSDQYGLAASVLPLQKELVGDTQVLLTILLGAVGLVMLIASANVANLQLARTTVRKREIATRMALGAGRRRVLRQLLTESVLLSALGGLASLPVALWGIDLLASFLPAEMPRLNDITLDLPVLGFLFGLSLCSGIFFGLAPALQSSKIDLQTALKESSRATTGSGARLRNMLVVAEVGLMLMLVTGAGLLIKSYWRLRQVDPGFQAEKVLSLRLAPPDTGYSDPERKRNFYRQVLERVQSLPGVDAVGGIHLLPMGGNNWDPSLIVEDHSAPAGVDLPSVDWRLITPDYFQAMGIRLTRGRWFSPRDNENAPAVAVVNETLAQKYWPNQDPIGKRIRTGFDGKDLIPIVGVVGDVKEQALDRPTHLEMYRPYDQKPLPSSLTLMVRTALDPVALSGAIRRELGAIDKDVPVADVQPLTQVVSDSLVARRSTMFLLGSFAGLALLLGAVGIYGVVNYAAGQRTREIGVRMALGATARNVLLLIVGQGVKLILLGLALGLAGSFLATRVLRDLLFGVSATDPVTFGLTAVALAGVGIIACLAPARRAARIDPLVALRDE
jgi:putative ABC transport system permease protein